MTSVAREVDPLWFRHVLGHYPTGVCVVTAMTADGEPVGMTVGSFTSVSLDPPLIAFLPDDRSTTWPKMQPSGTFCVNVLADGQEEVCKVFSTRGIDRFAELNWKLGRCGPVLSGATAWIACTLVDEHKYGDHSLVVGRVVELEAGAPSLPLLFFRGGYGQVRPSSMAVLDVGLVSDSALETAVRREIEQLVATTGVEVTAGVLGGAGRMVAIASAGKPGESLAVRIGQPVPFAPPFGAIFAAWGGSTTAKAWLDGADLSEQKRKEHELSLQRVRERGFAFIVGPDETWRLDALVSGVPSAQSPSSADLEAFASIVNNPHDLGASTEYHVASLSAPVFTDDRKLVMTVTMHGFTSSVRGQEIESLGQLLVDSCDRAGTAAAAGR